MKYLLLTHVPAFAGQSSGVLRLSADWLSDLTAQTAALRDAGFEVEVATPLHGSLDAKTLASTKIVETNLSQQPFTYTPLPGYRTASQFLASRRTLRTTIAKLTQSADVVQMGPGGHPFALGQVAWPVVRRAGKKAIFVFADDPFPALTRYAASGRNPAKRLAKAMAVRRLEQFCRKAVSEACCVLAHNDAVATRFAKAWSPRCHVLHPSGLRDADLAGDEALLARSDRLENDAYTLRVFCLGGPRLTQGVDHLIRAVAKARRLGGKIVLELFGELTTSADLMNVLRAEKSESAVRLHGPLAPVALPAAMDACDLVAAAALVPGVDQSFDLAMARGLGVVTYQTGMTDNELQSTDAAVVLPRGETNVLAQTLLDLSRDHDRVAHLSRAAHTHAAAVTLDATHRRRAKIVKELCQAS